MNRRTFRIHSIAALIPTVFVRAQSLKPATAPLRSDAALKAKASTALEKGLGFLKKQQKPDGSWASENGRWMEKDPVLVTCYATLALDLIQPKL